MDLPIKVGSRWLHLDCHYGDVEMSTVWPGGSDELSWTIGTQDAMRFTGGEPVVRYCGGVPIFNGRLSEPDPSQDRMVAQGLYRDAEKFLAVDGSGNPTTVPNTAVDAAIANGLTWSRPASLSSSAAAVDTSQGPVMLNVLLDSWAQEAGVRWGVNPFGQVYAKADDTTPTYQSVPIDGGLGFSLDSYASTLVGRYLSSTGYAQARRTNADAERQHGHSEWAVDLTPRGTITATKANQILDNMLTLGRAVPQWTTGLELSYGELLGLGRTPIALEVVQAGTVVRVPGGFDLSWRLQGQLFLDVPIGRTQMSDGTLKLTPADTAPQNLTEVITAVANR